MQLFAERLRRLREEHNMTQQDEDISVEVGRSRAGTERLSIGELPAITSFEVGLLVSTNIACKQV